MSGMMVSCEPLNRILDGKQISKEQAYEIFEFSKHNSDAIYKTANTLRNLHKKNTITFSKKAFFNLVNLCRDVCGYCTYKAEPGEQKASMMSKKNVQELSALAKKYHCTEALFVTGERPEEKYPEAKAWLKENGFSSTAEYLVYASEIALDQGLFPHTNAGNLTKSEMSDLKKTNVSMGLMLENSSERMSEQKMPHYLAPSKTPKTRLQVLSNAGELKIPMTTGVLVGIGETPHEIIDSLFAIKDLHDRFGHIQEIILQNFQPKQDTWMKNMPSAEENYFKTMVALARIIMPQMNIQIPPNLSPNSYQYFLDAGINDWGGISPLTQDYVNPEFGWPQIEFVDEHTKNAGFELKARFPIYPEIMDMTSPYLRDKMTPIMDKAGYVLEEYWR
ncbi:MAG: 7,8-didemethyl-8-hydroxy-5-deazariboflavin synthase subunit CofG [Nitrosopumilaceae archaeon]|nr:7,8-didemethyl-8-hydroxy-5-deazariboflavin synthase subunit CofG [Nitrosopumilaceae archaeon]